jgi:hypothetical protein
MALHLLAVVIYFEVVFSVVTVPLIVAGAEAKPVIAASQSVILVAIVLGLLFDLPFITPSS